MLLEWSRAQSVNIKELDEQHKRVIDRINHLFEAIQSRESRRNEEIKKSLTALVQCAKDHFQYEEGLFAEHQYPEAGFHKEKHDDLLRQIQVLLDRLEDRDFFSSKSASVITELLFLIQNWLIDHLLNTDKKYSDFLNKRGVF